MEYRTFYLFVAFVLTGVVIALLRRFTLPRKRKDDSAAKTAEAAPEGAAEPAKAEPEPEKPRPEGCCGQHAVCEKETLLATKAEYEYFDDEELDAFRGRGDSYTPEETAQFDEVLLTLRESEIAEWLKSLQQRGVTPPASVRDEALMILSERRNA